MKDYLASVKRNFTSPIVIAIFILASVLLILGEGRDAWFISSIVLLNTILAIVQESRARHELKKLELMSAPHARRYKKDGSLQDVLFDEAFVWKTSL
jgi:magnesium-transporting ATPase (P-type)